MALLNKPRAPSIKGFLPDQKASDLRSLPVRVVDRAQNQVWPVKHEIQVILSDDQSCHEFRCASDTQCNE